MGPPTVPPASFANGATMRGCSCSRSPHRRFSGCTGSPRGPSWSPPTSSGGALTSVLAPLWVGAGLLGVFYILGGSGWEKVGGYVTMASAFTAVYAASAMMLASAFGRVVLPTGKYRKAANVPGGAHMYPIEFELGEPGVK